MKLYVYKNDETGGTIYEWIGKNARFSLWFDDGLASWTFASKPSTEMDMAGDALTVDQLRELRGLIDSAIWEMLEGAKGE